MNRLESGRLIRDTATITILVIASTDHTGKRVTDQTRRRFESR
jgi:hypothetical protein